MYNDEFIDGQDEKAKRPGQGEGFHDDTHVVLFDDINPTDVNQGGLGDCWLLSSMATLAEWPDAIRGLFSPQKIAQDDKYTVKLFSWASKSWNNYVIDSRVPVDDSDGTATYVDISETGEIWPCLLEKAMAYYADGYENLNGGDPCYALAALTGCTEVEEFKKGMGADGDDWGAVYEPRWGSNNPQDAFISGDTCDEDAKSDTISVSDIKTQLQNFTENNYPMCACRLNSLSRALCEMIPLAACFMPPTDEQGIAYGHAYSLIHVMEDVAGTGYDLVCLRNPWGSRHEGLDKTEWIGDWGDGSDLWNEHPEVRDATGHVDGDDGLFWMPFDDFVRIYDTISVCKKNMGTPSRGKQSLQSRATSN